MISVNLAVFIGLLLNGSITAAFVLHLLNNKWFVTQEKKINLKKIKCEICGFFSFIGGQSTYWRCSNCESLNSTTSA